MKTHETLEQHFPTPVLVRQHDDIELLNDARIAIGTRIQISEDNHEELAGLPDDDPRSGLFHVYDWLTFLQESLVRCMDPALYGFSDDDVPVAEDEE